MKSRVHLPRPDELHDIHDGLNYRTVAHEIYNDERYVLELPPYLPPLALISHIYNL